MDLEPHVRRLSILTKDLQVVRFSPNWAQAEYLTSIRDQLSTRGRVRVIVLKARQLGISTLTEACLYALCFIIDHYKSLVMAHETPASQNLLNMTHLYWDTDPTRALYTTRFTSRNELAWVENGSSMRISTAGSKGGSRSHTYFGLHASEVAFWPDAQKTMLGLMQTIPDTQGTFSCIESTANGMGDYFYNTWDAASNGDIDYIPLFFPWHRHPEYMASYIGITTTLNGRLSDEERALKAIGLSDDRLAWRRWMIKNKCNNDVYQFMQEYPSNPDEAFIASGSNIFPSVDLQRAYDPEPGVVGELYETSSGVVFKPRANGPLTIYRAPTADRDWGQYFIGGDPARTRKSNADYTCAQVINRRTLEQVAEWRGRVDPVGFADTLFLLGRYYNEAPIAPETTGPGMATVGALLTKNYPRVYQQIAPTRTAGHVSDLAGWASTRQSKQLGMQWFLNAVVETRGTGPGGVWLGGLRIHSSVLYNEMKSYVRQDDGNYGPADESRGHDDTVMAMMIAIVCSQLEGGIGVYVGDDGMGGPGGGVGALIVPDRARMELPIDAGMGGGGGGGGNDELPPRPPWEEWGS